MSNVTLAFTVLAGVMLAQATSQEIRIDTFDKHSNRTGYAIYNPATGRIDQFDTKSNRLGHGTVTSPPSSTPSGDSRSVPPVRGTTR
jgi:hypothetical protein